MALIEINRTPSRRDLTWFGAVLLLFFLVIGGLLGRALDSDVARNILWAAGSLVALVYYVVPPLRRPMFVGWMYAAYPIGFVVSHVLLGLVYFGVVTPIGLLMRAVGHDPMARRFDRSAPTYWIARKPVTDVKRYFRQF
jgi:carbamoyltransferase